MNNLFADLDTDPMASPSMEEVRKMTHIANGGESTGLFPCPRCNGSGFYRGYGSCFRRDMAQDADRREQWKTEREAKGGQVDISAIQALFATAIDNDIKRPIFRAEGVEISKAPMHGANAGALYVKSNQGDYLGKIVGSQFHASREATAATLSQLQAVAVDPTAEAIKYARRTGRCSCCGHTLVDPVSIRAGIGPICAERWGLDYRREEARESLKEEG